jgi:hypothetical protein
MSFAITLIILAVALRVVLHVAITAAIIVALVGAGILWLVWKLKWVLLAIFGLEEIFGGRGDGGV